MPDSPQLLFSAPVVNRPLVGLTLLVVEDSRFASDAVRLLALRSGARLRRADCLRAAERHLRVYTPDVILIDLGLPDGRGEDLIARLSAATPRIPAILALSGEDYGAPRAMAAGADGFMAKPVASMVAFQKQILAALPDDPAPREHDEEDQQIAPDPIALSDDLRHAARTLDRARSAATDQYITRFLSTLGRCIDDAGLVKAAFDYRRRASSDRNRQTLLRVIEDRLDRSPAV